MRSFIAGFVLVMGLLAVGLTANHEEVKAQTQPVIKDVVFIHGLNGTASSWDTAKARYEADGFRTHALQLRSYGVAGDVAENVRLVENYIRDNNLTNVYLDAHSAGGIVALTIAVVNKNPAVKSVVLRDAASLEYNWITCWLIPDLCANSPVVAAIKSAPPSSLPIFQANDDGSIMQHVDCTKKYAGVSHPDFQTNTAVNNDAVKWPSVNPCTPVSTPTPTPTPTPTCSFWQWVWGLC